MTLIKPSILIATIV